MPWVFQVIRSPRQYTAGCIVFAFYGSEGKQYPFFDLLAICHLHLHCALRGVIVLGCHISVSCSWCLPCILVYVLCTMQPQGCASKLLGPSSLSWAVLYIACALFAPFCIRWVPPQRALGIWWLGSWLSTADLRWFMFSVKICWNSNRYVCQ